MDTAEQRAEHWLQNNVPDWGPVVLAHLTVLLKEQDKLTRHACAEVVSTYTDHHACMNVKAV